MFLLHNRLTLKPDVLDLFLRHITILLHFVSNFRGFANEYKLQIIPGEISVNNIDRFLNVYIIYVFLKVIDERFVEAVNEHRSQE